MSSHLPSGSFLRKQETLSHSCRRRGFWGDEVKAKPRQISRGQKPRLGGSREGGGGREGRGGREGGAWTGPVSAALPRPLASVFQLAEPTEYPRATPTGPLPLSQGTVRPQPPQLWERCVSGIFSMTREWVLPRRAFLGGFPMEALGPGLSPQPHRLQQRT